VAKNRVPKDQLSAAAAANCQFHLKICAAAAAVAAYIFKDMQLPFKFTTTAALRKCALVLNIAMQAQKATCRLSSARLHK
jgi:hypothetical protein